MQVTKQGFAFVFDRVTGEPVWPDRGAPCAAERCSRREGRADAAVSDEAGAMTPQGVTLDDAFDLTPELKAQAQEQMKKFKLGPLYTPPSMQGTLQRPGVIGGANWGGAAFDPETQTLFVKTSNAPAVVRIHAFDRSPDNPRASEVDADFIGDVGGSTSFTPQGEGGRGLPLVKPPYGELVAIDLSTGEFKWRVPFGDTPSVRSHPALAGVKLPDRLGASGVGGVIVTKGGLVIGAGGDSVLYAFDKTTGKELAALRPRPPCVFDADDLPDQVRPPVRGHCRRPGEQRIADGVRRWQPPNR